MARDLSGTGQYLTLSNGLGRTANGGVWVSLWVWLDSTAASVTLFSLGVGGSANHRRTVNYSTGFSGILTYTVNVAGVATQTTATAVTAGQWVHVLAEWTGDSFRACTVNGGTRYMDMTYSQVTTAPDQIRVGSSHVATTLLDGRVAYVGVFSGSPHANDFADVSGSGTIANALHPTLTHSAANLLAYWDLDGSTSPEPDGIAANDLVLTGSPAQIASPGIILPSGPLVSGTVSGSATGSTTSSMSVTAATGGTSPYTYQWYRDTSPGFTASGANDVVGATSLTLNDTGLTASTTYYYKVISTDNVAATVTSNEASVTTTSGVSATARNRVILVL